MYVDFDTIGLVWPEVILVLLAAWIYVGGTIQRTRWWWTVFAIMAYVVTGIVLARTADAFVGNGLLAADFLGDYLRWFALIIGILTTLLVSSQTTREFASETIGTLMLLIVGLMLIARANDLVFLFVSLELVSIPTYILLYLGRRDRATSEAAVKYFFLSIFSSAVLLYGMTLLYGLSGTTSIAGGAPKSIHDAAAGGLGAEAGITLMPIAFAMLVAGLGFKITAVPFHFYAPDVYQGATNANAGLLAVAPKIAGLVALVRILAALPTIGGLGWQMVLVLAVLTMTLGNVCALWQKNIRRLLAYSSIAHAGYMLMGLAVVLAAGGNSQLGGAGAAASVFYLLVYSFASLGTFAALASLSSSAREVSGLEEIAGLGKSRPVTAAVIAVCMFSLAGIPPLAGFWGKFALFGETIRLATTSADGSLATWFTLLAVCGALNAAIAAAYYLRIVATMFFQPAACEASSPPSAPASLAMVVAALLVVLLGAYPRSVIRATQRAADSYTAQIATVNTVLARTELAADEK